MTAAGGKVSSLHVRAQWARDYENSSLPSSVAVKHKKIQDSGENTGSKPGHAGHSRKRQVPTTAPVLLPPPQEAVEDPDFKKPSKSIVKQLEVTEYQADVYYNSKTGERTMAELPCGMGDDFIKVGVVKAFWFWLTLDACHRMVTSGKFP